MKPEAYERTLKARAFDVARYLLPLATNTSLGQIVNARTLETQVSRLLSHPAAEVRDLGIKLRDAAIGPAWNVRAGWRCLRPKAAMDLLNWPPKLPTCSRAKSAPHHPRQIRPAQRIRHPDPAELAQAAAEILARIPSQAPVVDLVERLKPWK